MHIGSNLEKNNISRLEKTADRSEFMFYAIVAFVFFYFGLFLGCAFRISGKDEG